MVFSNAGLILSSAANGVAATVSNQVAGVTSASYVVRAVQQSTTTATCTAAFTGTHTVSFGYECNDPTSCATGNLLTVNGTMVQSNNNAPLLGYNYTPISLTFDSSGNSTTTPISFKYEDVGQITLRMSAIASGATLVGSYGSFTVLPDHFTVDVCPNLSSGNCPAGTAAATATSGVLAVAGTLPTQTGAAFSASVRAMSNDGVVTPSFGTAGTVSGTNANSNEAVTISANCVTPTTCASNAGVLAGQFSGSINPTRNAFSNGIFTENNLTWSEVGVITIGASENTFMGVVPASPWLGISNAAGRFRPDHFDTTVTAPMSCPAGASCTAPVTTMAYSGQAFTNATVTARNANGATTSNYQGSFAKAVTLSAVASNGGTGIATTAPGGTLSANTVAATSFALGVNSISTSQPVFTFATSPTVPTDVYIQADESSGGDSVSSLRSPASTSEGGVKVVSGRLKVNNAYGSELLPLSMTATAQFYNASSSWVTSSTDGVTSFNTAMTPTGNLVATIINTPLALSNISVVGPGSVTMSGGIKTFTLTAPGPNATGIVDIRFNAPSYLLTDSITGCVPCSLPGRASFGIYKGNNSIIYMRENY
jgi:hypothetical protein